MRQDYIEPDYVNGVVNANGEMVIRPLNKEEKRFLNSYYEEVIGANFNHDPELKQLNKDIKKLKDIETPTKEDEVELMSLQMEYFAKADEVLLYPDHEDQKKLYGENNARNRCVYNRTKAMHILDELNDATYDNIHKTVHNSADSGEMLMINLVEPRLKTILRKKKKPKDTQKDE